MVIPNSQTFGKESSPRSRPDYRIEITRMVQVAAYRVYVQWVLRNPSEITGYTFEIFRSGSSNGPWVSLGTVTDEFLYVDGAYSEPRDQSAPGLFSLHRTIYYRVVATHSTDPTVSTEQVLEAGLDRRRRAMVKKLRRDAYIKIRKGSGTEVAILKRRWWGTPCNCKSSSGQVVRSHCGICHGTGIETGYWDPVYTFGKRSSSPVDVQTTPAGKTETHRILATIPYIPKVEPLDILVFLRDNKRYIINSVNTTEIHTVTVHQELVVSELAKSAREYAVVVDNWHTPEWF